MKDYIGRRYKDESRTTSLGSNASLSLLVLKRLSSAVLAVAESVSNGSEDCIHTWRSAASTWVKAEAANEEITIMISFKCSWNQIESMCARVLRSQKLLDSNSPRSGRGSFVFNMQIYGNTVHFHGPEPACFMLKCSTWKWVTKQKCSQENVTGRKMDTRIRPDDWCWKMKIQLRRNVYGG